MRSKTHVSTGGICVAIFGLFACSQAFGSTLAQQNFIDKVYQDLLGRPADPVGLAAYLTLFDKGGTSFDVAHGVDTSQEYYSILVGSYYQSYLYRPSDAGSVPLVSLLVGGATDQQVQATILGSSEYFTNRGAGDNAGFLNALYQDLLNRPVDAAGIAAFLPLLNAATPRSQIAIDLLKSTEYEGDLVNGYFLRFLGRPAGADGAPYVSELGVGVTDETVIAQILGTPEFFDLAQRQTAAPEPGTLLLFGLGSGLVLLRCMLLRLSR